MVVGPRPGGQDHSRTAGRRSRRCWAMMPHRTLEIRAPEDYPGWPCLQGTRTAETHQAAPTSLAIAIDTASPRNWLAKSRLGRCMIGCSFHQKPRTRSAPPKLPPRQNPQQPRRPNIQHQAEQDRKQSQPEIAVRQLVKLQPDARGDTSSAADKDFSTEKVESLRSINAGAVTARTGARGGMAANGRSARQNRACGHRHIKSQETGEKRDVHDDGGDHRRHGRRMRVFP